MLKIQKGSALAYVLIGVALLAMLAYTISGEGGGQQHKQMSNAQTKLLASDLIKHSTSATMVVKQMEAFGINYDEIRFDLPGTANYALNTSEQIYHPSGGGLGVFNATDKYFNDVADRGWQWQNLNNVEWSVSTANDLMFTFLDVDDVLCEEINKQLHGSTAVPITTVSFKNTFRYNFLPNDDLVIAKCADCEGIKSMCIKNSASNAFYNIIGSR